MNKGDSWLIAQFSHRYAAKAGDWKRASKPTLSADPAAGSLRQRLLRWSLEQKAAGLKR